MNDSISLKKLYKTSLPDEDVVLRSIELGANIYEYLTLLPIRERPLIHVASYWNQIRVVHTLLEHHGIDPGLRYSSETPLELASKAGNVDIVKLLMSYNAEVGSAEAIPYSSLTAAIKHGHIQVVQALLDYDSESRLDKHVNPDPLITAAQHGHLEIFQFLLKKCVDASKSIEKDELLHKAIKGRNISIIRLVMQLRSTANLPIPSTDFLLIHVPKKEREEIRNLLHEFGAKP